MEAAGAGATKRIWISDGSLVPFSDSVSLPATHPAVFGMKARYKGDLDEAVPLGFGLIAAERAGDVFVPEAEWCILLQPGIAGPESFNLTTPIVLQGLIEGKWLNRLLGTSEWFPASIGNNLLAAGPGIATTLAAVEAGIRGDVTVSYTYERDGQEQQRTQQTSLADLRGQNMLGLVRAVLSYCRETQQQLDGIDVSAMGEAAAVVNERWRMRKALQFVTLPIPNPLNFRRPLAVAQRVVRSILDDGLGAKPGTSITIRTTDAAGAIVGEGQLDLHAVMAREVTLLQPIR